MVHSSCPKEPRTRRTQRGKKSKEEPQASVCNAEASAFAGHADCPPKSLPIRQKVMGSSFRVQEGATG